MKVYDTGYVYKNVFKLSMKNHFIVNIMNY